jgi:8-oxo-dGTP pyrophosphatase MutT (NUDIX family)
LSPDKLRNLLASIAGGAGVVYGEEIMGDLEAPPIPAAVLVPIILHDAPSLLLTRRTSHLKKHAGQVSFPGGRIDPEDPTPEAAALREAEEEIGLSPENVEIVGRMDDYVTGTGYRITPVIGLLPPGLIYRPSPHEVEAVFEFPFSVLLDPEAPRRQKQHVRDHWREYWVWPHPDHFIWGATAAIMMHLAGKLRASANAACFAPANRT